MTTTWTFAADVTPKQQTYLLDLLAKREHNYTPAHVDRAEVSRLIDNLVRAPRKAATEEERSIDQQSEAHGEDNDCAVKALAHVLAKDYAYCQGLLNVTGRQQGEGTLLQSIIRALHKEGLDAEQVPFGEMIRRYPGEHKSLNTITSTHPRRFRRAWSDGNKYLMVFHAHIAAVVRGQLRDWADEKRMTALAVYRIVPLKTEGVKKEVEVFVTTDNARIEQLEQLLAEQTAATATAWAAAEQAKEQGRTIIFNAATEERTELAGLNHKQFPELLAIMAARTASGNPLNVWLAGPAGSGKTHAAHAAAKALGLSFYLQGAMSMPHELVGFVDANGRYHDTPFVKAYRDGGVVLLDELDSGDASALLVLNAALANGGMSLPNGDQIERHKDCIILGAANTYGLGATADYIGRTKLDGAFLDRFVKLAWAYDEALEAAMCGNADWAKQVQRARASARKAGLKIIISPRATVAGAALVAAGFSAERAAELTYLSGLTPEQINLIKN
jgi:hypothetical protein